MGINGKSVPLEYLEARWAVIRVPLPHHIIYVSLSRRLRRRGEGTDLRGDAVEIPPPRRPLRGGRPTGDILVVRRQHVLHPRHNRACWEQDRDSRGRRSRGLLRGPLTGEVKLKNIPFVHLI